MYIPSTTIIEVLPEEIINHHFKEKLENMDATIFEKCGNPVTQADDEEFVV